MATRPGKREILRPLRLAWTFFRISAMNEVQYRVNFFLQLVESFVALGTALVVLTLVFSYTNDLAGWSRYELLAVMGVHILMGGIIHSAIQPNMERLIEDIRKGTLDYWLTKPEDAQVLASVRELRLWQAIDILVGAVVLGVAVVRLDSGVGAGYALAFAGALLLGGVMIYCFWLILTIGAFWIVRMEFIVELFEGVYQAGRWPVSVYPPLLRAGLTFLVPLAFAITVPAQAITTRLTPETFLMAVAFAIALAAFTRWLWRLGLRRYAGASA
jgi:ABC-2 type transport system permease protein